MSVMVPLAVMVRVWDVRSSVTEAPVEVLVGVLVGVDRGRRVRVVSGLAVGVGVEVIYISPVCVLNAV